MNGKYLRSRHALAVAGVGAAVGLAVVDELRKDARDETLRDLDWRTEWMDDRLDDLAEEVEHVRAAVDDDYERPEEHY